MEKRMENIEKLLQTLVDANTTPRNEQVPGEDVDDEDWFRINLVFLWIATVKKGQRNDIIWLFIEHFLKYIVSTLLQSCIHSQVLPLVHLLLECQLTLKSALILPAATVHVMQPLLTAATVHYVIECYWTSFTYNVLAICSNGNLI